MERRQTAVIQRVIPGEDEATGISLLETTSLSGVALVIAGLIAGVILVCAALLTWTTALLLWLDLGDVLGAVRVPSPDGGGFGPQGAIAIFLLLTLPLEWLNTLVHESAHALCGRMVGFSCEAIHIGPLTIRREWRRIRIGIRPRLLGGSTGSYPVSGEDLRLRYLVFTVAGPLSSLLLAFVAARIAHAYLLQMRTIAAPAALSPLIETLLAGLSLVALLSFFENILPFKGRDGGTDGLILYHLIKGDRSGELRLVLALLKGYSLRNVPVGDLDPALIHHALALTRNAPGEFVTHGLAYSWSLEHDDIARAGTHLDRAVATLKTAHGPTSTFAHELAFFEARHRHHPVLARFWLERGQGDRYVSFMRPRALAAILLAEGRPAEAAAQAIEGLSALERFTEETGRSYPAEGKTLRALIADAERPLAEQAAPQA